MKYPTNLFISIPKKKKKIFYNKKEAFKEMSTFLKINKIKISRKQHDERAGVCYRVKNIIEYREEFEINLKRKKINENNSNKSSTTT